MSQSETVVQQQARLKLARRGSQMWRNNVGACVDDAGRLVRYGLANESSQMNRCIKSSDLIGITPVVVTPDMVGKTVGVFTALECKRSDWRRINSDERATAQAAFIKIVKDVGGFAGFVTCNEDIDGILR